MLAVLQQQLAAPIANAMSTAGIEPATSGQARRSSIELRGRGRGSRTWSSAFQAARSRSWLGGGTRVDLGDLLLSEKKKQNEQEAPL
jgi:hypothetical protein